MEKFTERRRSKRGQEEEEEEERSTESKEWGSWNCFCITFLSFCPFLKIFFFPFLLSPSLSLSTWQPDWSLLYCTVAQGRLPVVRLHVDV